MLPENSVHITSSLHIERHTLRSTGSSNNIFKLLHMTTVTHNMISCQIFILGLGGLGRWAHCPGLHTTQRERDKYIKLRLLKPCKPSTAPFPFLSISPLRAGQLPTSASTRSRSLGRSIHHHPHQFACLVSGGWCPEGGYEKKYRVRGTGLLKRKKRQTVTKLWDSWLGLGYPGHPLGGRRRVPLHGHERR